MIPDAIGRNVLQAFPGGRIKSSTSTCLPWFISYECHIRVWVKDSRGLCAAREKVRHGVRLLTVWTLLESKAGSVELGTIYGEDWV